jgi:hypothetical protein
VEHEIRLDIERYEQQGLTPLEFGVRIRTHPVLRITAKMGAARPAYASYGGRRIQTRYFRENDAVWLRANRDAADELIRNARAAGSVADGGAGGTVIYRDVEADLIARFLGTYRAHPDSPDLDSELVRRYIAKQRGDGGLEQWSVAVMAADDDRHGTVRLGGRDFARIARAKLRETGPERADIKTLMSKDHRVVDLAILPKDARAMNEAALMDARNFDPVGRTRGLLLLYPIDPRSEPDPQNVKTRTALEAVDDLIGMALVFPGNAEPKTGVRHTYVSVDLSELEVDGPDDAELAGLRGEDET